jgi:hypothetical protein
MIQVVNGDEEDVGLLRTGELRAKGREEEGEAE